MIMGLTMIRPLLLLLLLSFTAQAQERPFTDEFYHDDGHFNVWYFLHPSARQFGFAGTTPAMFFCYDDAEYVLRWTMADIWWIAWNGYRPPEKLEGDDLAAALEACGYNPEAT